MSESDAKTERHQVLMLLEYYLLHDGKQFGQPLDPSAFATSVVSARMERLGMPEELACRSTQYLFDEGLHPLLTAVPDDIDELRYLAQLAISKRDPELLAAYGKVWGDGPGIWRAKVAGATERFLPCPLPEGWLPVAHRTDGGLRIESGELVLVLTVNDPGRLSITIASARSRPSDADASGILSKLRKCHNIREVDVDVPAELGLGEDMSQVRSYFATIGDKPISRWRGKKKGRR